MKFIPESLVVILESLDSPLHQRCKSNWINASGFLRYLPPCFPYIFIVEIPEKFSDISVLYVKKNSVICYDYGILMSNQKARKTKP